MKIIKINKDDISSFKNIKIFDIHSNDETLTFKISNKDYKKNFQLIKDAILDIDDDKKMQSFLKNNLIYVLGFLIMLVMLFMQNKSYRQIEFTNDDTYSEDIVFYIHDKSLNFGKYYFLIESVKNIENHLQSKYPNYEFIGIEKDNSILKVDIKKEDEHHYDLEDNTVGDLIARKDGYIVGYKVKSGIVVVETMQVVKKGDVLVSGNLLINHGGVKYVSSFGEVYAQTYDYETIKVDKEVYEIKRTGKEERYCKLVFFNKNFINKSDFENYQSQYRVIFEINGFVKLVEVVNYEIYEEYKNYDSQSAIIEGFKIIQDNFIREHNEDEKIINCAKVALYEYENYYEIVYLVKKYENIAVFQKMNVE